MAQTPAPRLFGTLPDGTAVQAFTLTSPGGLELEAITLGCGITQLKVPDRAGALGDVCLGWSDLEGYRTNPPYLGVQCGRVAGRLRGAAFHIDGKSFSVTRNIRDEDHIHGGAIGFSHRVWQAEPGLTRDGLPKVRFTLTSENGEEGFPGNLKTAVTLSLTADNSVVLETIAVADQPTPFTPTNHTYFNLSGNPASPITDHTVEIVAGAMAETDDHLFSTGARLRVEGTPSDFRTPKLLADVLGQLKHAHGDFYFLRPPSACEAMRPLIRAARISHAPTGRVLTVHTDEDCLQFYTGVSLPEGSLGKQGVPLGKHSGLCLETQGFTESVLHPELGDVVLRPGRVFRRTTVWSFSTE